MQYFAAAIALLAFGASALPTDPKPTPPSNDGKCENGDSYCCTGNALISLDCTLAILSPTCGQQICCTNVGSGSQECTNQNGIVINIPINIDVL